MRLSCLVARPTQQLSSRIWKTEALQATAADSHGDYGAHLPTFLNRFHCFPPSERSWFWLGPANRRPARPWPRRSSEHRCACLTHRRYSSMTELLAAPHLRKCWRALRGRFDFLERGDLRNLQQLPWRLADRLTPRNRRWLSVLELQRGMI